MLAGVAPIIALLRSSTSATDLFLVVRDKLHSCGRDEPSHRTHGHDNGVKPRKGSLKCYHQQHIKYSLDSLTSSTDPSDTLDTWFESIEATVQRWDA